MLRYFVREDVVLRLPEERDARELLEVIERNRVHLEAWLHWTHSTHSREEVLRFIEMARRDFVKPDALHLLIFCDKRIIGSCGLIINSVNQFAEIGYWIDADFSGKGIVTDCCRSLIDHAFFGLALNRVQIRCAVENKKSAAIAQRLGFLYEGTLRQTIRTGDRLDDELCFGLLHTEWKSASNRQ